MLKIETFYAQLFLIYHYFNKNQQFLYVLVTFVQISQPKSGSSEILYGKIAESGTGIMLLNFNLPFSSGLLSSSRAIIRMIGIMLRLIRLCP